MTDPDEPDVVRYDNRHLITCMTCDPPRQFAVRVRAEGEHPDAITRRLYAPGLHDEQCHLHQSGFPVSPQSEPHPFAPLRWWDDFHKQGRCRHCFLPRHSHPVLAWWASRPLGDRS